MSSHRAGRSAVDPRAAGRRRIVGATTASAACGTALAVLFGSMFAQASAATSEPTTAAPIQPATAAATLAEPEQDSAPSQPSAAATGKHSGTTAKTHKATPAPAAAPKPPAAAPQSAEGDPAGSSGGS